MSEEVDISKALKAAIATGKVEFGVDQTEKAVKAGKAQMIVLADNCPSEFLVSNNKVRYTSTVETTWSWEPSAESPSPYPPWPLSTRVLPTS